MTYNSMRQWFRLRSVPSSVLAVGIIVSGSRAFAQEQWREAAKIYPQDAQEDAHFGWAVGMTNGLAVITAPLDRVNEPFYGAAYVFDVGAERQIFKLIENPRRSGASFGWSMGASEDRAVIAGPYGEAESDNGAVYLFDLKSGRQMRRLKCENPDDPFPRGCSVAMEGRVVVVGSSVAADVKPWAGAAYVFDADSGRQLHKLVAPDGQDNDHFGNAVAVSGDHIIVGAYWRGVEGMRVGAVYVYNLAGEFLYEVSPPDPVEDMGYAGWVAASGNRLVISAYHDNVNGRNSGSVYVYSLSTGELLRKIVPTDGLEEQSFGNCIAIDGQRLAIAAQQDDDRGYRSGSVYLYDLDTLECVTKLTASDGVEFDQFGDGVDIENGRIVVGARGVDDRGWLAGAAYIFEAENLLQISPSEIVGGESGTFAVVGARPAQSIWLLYSLRGVGSTYIPQLNVTADLIQPRRATERGLTDAAGDWRTSLVLPHVTQATPVWFQAVQQENKTNVASMRIVPE